MNPTGRWTGEKTGCASLLADKLNYLLSYYSNKGENNWTGAFWDQEGTCQHVLTLQHDLTVRKLVGKDDMLRTK